MSKPSHSFEAEGLSSGEASASTRERQARQDLALTTVRKISKRAGRDIPITPDANAENFMHGPGVYILDPEVIERGPIRDATFELDAQMLSGAADSAHAVIAGDLAVDYESGLRTTPVAAKCYQKRPFEDRLERTRREITMMRFMQEQGELSLEPVAVAIGPRGEDEEDGAIVLLSRFNEELYTLDNAPWGRGMTPQNVDTAVTAAATLGRFNSYGFRHGDAKIKNIASVADENGFIGGGVSMIDFETTLPFDLKDSIQTQTTVAADLGLMLKSLVSKGFFSQRADRFGYKGDPHKADVAISQIADAYLSAWESHDLATQESVYNGLIDTIATLQDQVTDLTKV